jgi:hypothetical protein
VKRIQGVPAPGLMELAKCAIYNRKPCGYKIRMKKIILFISVFLLVSCGNKSPSDNDKFQPEINCGGITKSSSTRTACMVKFEMNLLSSTLPEKIKIGIRHEDEVEFYFNECDPHREFVVNRSQDIDVVTFGFYGGAEIHWVIVDMGADCTNDAIFFDGAVIPTVVGKTATYSLNN